MQNCMNNNALQTHTHQRHYVHAVLFTSRPVKEKKQHSGEELIYNDHCVRVHFVYVYLCVCV